ncbi:MAG: tripartite tricarboxylate transporter TctB family protein [Alphaproteobacteria bacterium]|nr:tripartite tricarboxylate transporter TctB family protein [Alphaproteobacteria bacterium]
MNRDFWTSLFLIFLSFVLYRESTFIEDVDYGSMKADVWPTFLVMLLIVLSISMLVKSLMEYRQATQSSTQDNENAEQTDSVTGWTWLINPMIVFVLFFLFLITLDYLGMLIGGIFFTFITMTLLGQISWRTVPIYFAISVISISGMWAIFTFGLRVMLPEGVLFTVW